MALDSDGSSRLVVLDIKGVEVVTLDRSGAVLARWPTSPGPVDSRPLGDADIAVAPSGEVAVSRAAYGQVERYAADGRLLEIVRHPELRHPASVEYSDVGTLLVRGSADGSPISRVFSVAPGGDVAPITNVPPGGELSSFGAQVLLTTPSSVLLFRDWQPRVVLGGSGRGAAVDQGDFDAVGLSDAVAVRRAAWVTDGITVQRFSSAGALELQCRPEMELAPSRLAAIEDTLYISTAQAIYPMKVSSTPTRQCRRPRLRLSNVQLSKRQRQLDLRLSVRFRVNHRARVTGTILAYDRVNCPTGICAVRALKTVPVRRGVGAVTYHMRSGQLPPGAYAVRVGARSSALRARADAQLLTFRVARSGTRSSRSGDESQRWQSWADTRPWPRREAIRLGQAAHAEGARPALCNDKEQRPALRVSSHRPGRGPERQPAQN